jgi:predicted metal-dependent phosphoesterase TrpH
MFQGSTGRARSLAGGGIREADEGRMIIDLHVHTRLYSGCSSIEPGDLILRARQAGLDGIALTEHGILWKEEKLAPLRDRAAEMGLTLFAGEEVTCFEKGTRKDFLIFGIKESLGGNLTPRSLINRVHEEGGVVIAAHPFKPSRLGTGYHGVGEEILELDLDAIELYHPNHGEEALERILAAATLRGLPLTGGSDAHELYQVGRYSTRFLNCVRTVEDLAGEIRAGRIEALNLGRPAKRIEEDAV